MDFAVPVEDSLKVKERKVFRSFQRSEQTIEQESDGDTNCNWRARGSQQRISIETGGLGNKQTSGDHPNDSIIKIGLNTEKNPGDLRLVVTQTPERNHQLTLVWKTLKRVKWWLL